MRIFIQDAELKKLAAAQPGGTSLSQASITFQAGSVEQPT
jgi:hypothetical protein